MAEALERLVKRLYPKDMLPYNVFCDGKGESYGYAKVIHVPGVSSGFKGDVDELIESSSMIGFIGVAVEREDLPVSEQRTKFCWSAVDVDAEHNKNLLRHVDYLALALPDSIIRTSKSGAGLHIILPHATGPVDMSYEDAKMYGKQECKRALQILLERDIHPCVYGTVNLWLWSKDGKQQTLYWGDK